ncbi:GPA2/GPB5 Receptor, partial [Frankliniella occidentalis]
ETPGRLHAGR